MAWGTAIQAVFGGDTGPLQAAAKRVEQISSGVNNVLGSIGVGLSAIGAVTAFVTLGKGAIALGGKLSDLAVQLGINVEKLQVLTSLARDAGVAQETLVKALVKVRTSASEAEEGNKTYADAFAVLNIRTKEFLALPAEQRLARIGQAYAAATDKNAAFNAVAGILGEKAGPKLMEVLGILGTTSFPKLEQSARAAGQVMSAETVAALDQAGDAIEAFKQRATIAVGNIIVNFRSEEGLKLLGMQFAKVAGGFGAKVVDALYEANQIVGAVFTGTFRALANRFRDFLLDSLSFWAQQVNKLLPKKMEIDVAGIQALKSTGETVAESIARAIAETKPGTFAKDVAAYWDKAIASQKVIVDRLNQVDFKKPADALRNAGQEFVRSGEAAAGAIDDSAEKFVKAGGTVGEALAAGGVTFTSAQKLWSASIKEMLEAGRQIGALIAGIRGSKQFDQLSDASLAQLIAQNERKIAEIKRRGREAGLPSIAYDLEAGRLQAENMNARQDLNQRTKFQSDLARLGESGARRLYDPFVFEELLKRFDSSRGLEQKSLDTLDEIRRGQERLLMATFDQADATRSLAGGLEDGLTSLAGNLKAPRG